MEIDWKEIFENPIKKYSTNKIEEAIAKCLSDLVGKELEANIKSIDYNPSKNDIEPENKVEIHIEIRKPTKDLLNK